VADCSIPSKSYFRKEASATSQRPFLCHRALSQVDQIQSPDLLNKGYVVSPDTFAPHHFQIYPGSFCHFMSDEQSQEWHRMILKTQSCSDVFLPFPLPTPPTFHLYLQSITKDHTCGERELKLIRTRHTWYQPLLPLLTSSLVRGLFKRSLAPL